MCRSVEQDSPSLFGDSERVEVQEGESTPEHVLWVDKYAPRHYTDLLSDDVSH